MNKLHRIKKYKNRLMYDTATSKLITLKQLAEMLRRGSDIRIEDNDSGNDITRLAVLQMMLEIEKSGKSIRNILPDIVASIFDLPQLDLVKVLKELIQKNKHTGDLGRVWAQRVVNETSLASLIPVNMEKKIVIEIAGQLDSLYMTILEALEKAVQNRTSIFEIYDNILKAMEKAIEERDSVFVVKATGLPSRRHDRRKDDHKKERR
jgi:polyhydroxyalkanoate synthesis repressor PhaR